MVGLDPTIRCSPEQFAEGPDGRIKPDHDGVKFRIQTVTIQQRWNEKGRRDVKAYVALLRKDPDSDYGVDFPDFPGCITAGRTVDGARRMAREALDLHVEGMLEDGESLPTPTALEVVMTDRDNAGAVAFLVPGRRSAGEVE